MTDNEESTKSSWQSQRPLLHATVMHIVRLVAVAFAAYGIYSTVMLLNVLRSPPQRCFEENNIFECNLFGNEVPLDRSCTDNCTLVRSTASNKQGDASACAELPVNSTGSCSPSGVFINIQVSCCSRFWVPTQSRSTPYNDSNIADYNCTRWSSSTAPFMDSSIDPRPLSRSTAFGGGFGGGGAALYYRKTGSKPCKDPSFETCLYNLKYVGDVDKEVLDDSRLKNVISAMLAANVVSLAVQATVWIWMTASCIKRSCRQAPSSTLIAAIAFVWETAFLLAMAIAFSALYADFADDFDKKVRPCYSDAKIDDVDDSVLFYPPYVAWAQIGWACLICIGAWYKRSSTTKSEDIAMSPSNNRLMANE